MKKTSKLVVISMILMTISSFAGLFKIEVGGEKIGLASISLLIGIATFFVTRKTNDDINEGLNFKSMFRLLMDKKVIVLVLMPTIMNVVCFLIAKIFIPEFITHLKARTSFLSFQTIVILLVQLFVFTNAIFYGIVFRKTDNACVSTIAHFTANLLGTVAIMFC